MCPFFISRHDKSNLFAPGELYAEPGFAWPSSFPQGWRSPVAGPPCRCSAGYPWWAAPRRRQWDPLKIHGCVSLKIDGCPKINKGHLRNWWFWGSKSLRPSNLLAIDLFSVFIILASKMKSHFSGDIPHFVISTQVFT